MFQELEKHLTEVLRVIIYETARIVRCNPSGNRKRRDIFFMKIYV